MKSSDTDTDDTQSIKSNNQKVSIFIIMYKDTRNSVIKFTTNWCSVSNERQTEFSCLEGWVVKGEKFWDYNNYPTHYWAWTSCSVVKKVDLSKWWALGKQMTGTLTKTGKIVFKCITAICFRFRLYKFFLFMYFLIKMYHVFLYIMLLVTIWACLTYKLT